MDKNIVHKLKNIFTNRALIALAAIVVLLFILIFVRGNEDTWVKDGQGSWIKHGNPSLPPPDGINDFDTCAKKYTVQKTEPAACITPDGRSFIQSMPDGQILVLPSY